MSSQISHKRVSANSWHQVTIQPTVLCPPLISAVVVWFYLFLYDKIQNSLLHFRCHHVDCEGSRWRNR